MQLQHDSFDPRKPFDPSGLRIGTPSITSRGMLEKDMEPIAEWIDRVLKVADDADRLHKIRAEIADSAAFPAPGIASRKGSIASAGEHRAAIAGKPGENNKTRVTPRFGSSSSMAEQRELRRTASSSTSVRRRSCSGCAMRRSKVRTGVRGPPVFR